MSTVETLLLDPALPPPLWQTLQELIARGAPYACYVEGPITTGFGVGMVRRHDALLHGIRRRVEAGVEESMAEASARANLLRGVFAEEGAVHDPAAAELLTYEGYLEAGRAISGLPMIEPTMLYVNLLVPGQELMVHSDTPEFVGCSKGNTPEWLLVVMHHAGLFEDHRIDIAGGVTFLTSCEGGDFVFWDGEGIRRRVRPRPNTAIKLDADRLFHAVERVGGPAAPAPPVSTSSRIAPDGDGWLLSDKGQVVHRYGPGEVRVSMQWKARCLPEAPGRPEPLVLSEVLDRLEADLRRRGVLSGPRPEDVAFGLMMIDAYVPFPDT